MLIVEDAVHEATLVVPTVRRVTTDSLGVGEVEFVVTDSTRHTTTTFDLSATSVTAYKFVAEVTLGLPNGQYTYTVSDTNGEVGSGILQVGLTDVQQKTYTTNLNVVTYEQ